jgi:hypothetical protein
MLIEGGPSDRGPRVPPETITLAAALALVAGVLHAAVSVDHFHEALLFGVFFVAVALFQCAWGVALYRSGGQAWLRAGAIANGVVVLVWMASRTVGLPVGPERWTAEGVGVVDVAATADELLLVTLALLVLPAARRPGRLGAAAAVTAGSLCVLSLTALMAVGHHH